MTLLDHLFVGHEGLRPVDGPKTDAEQRDPERDAEHDVEQVGQPDERQEDRGCPVDREVADDEAQRAEDRQGEQDRDLALGALGRLGVVVGSAVDVGR